MAKEAIGAMTTGVLTAGVTQLIFAPFDRYKLMLQLKRTMTELVEDGKLDQDDLEIDIKNLTDPTFFGYGPITDLFRGGLYNTLRYFPTQAINYALANKIKNIGIMLKPQEQDSGLIKLSKNIAVGGITGTISLAFIYGFDVYIMDKRLGIKSESKFMKSQRPNIVSYYNGFLISILGVMVYRGGYFGLFDALKNKDGESAKSAASKGFAITIIAGLLSYPIDTIRSRMCITGESGLEAYTNIVEKYGYFALWDGASIGMIKGLFGAVMMGVMARAQKTFSS